MRTFEFASGTGRVVVDQEGARLAELHPRPDLPNLLWRGEATPFPGGDRLWIAPEVELFYDGDPTDRANWRCPTELDPGDWEVEESEQRHVTLRQTAFGARMRRGIAPLLDPPAVMDLPWAGYRVANEVRTDQRWSGWHLVMVPTPARLYVGEAREPLEMVAPAPGPDDGWVTASPAAPAWKLGFAPPSNGRVVLAALGDEDPGPLVVVLGHADPQGIYVDVPPDGDRGTAVQVWNAGADGFAELEHHAPLGQAVLESTVIGAWGEHDARLRLLEHLATG